MKTLSSPPSSPSPSLNMISTSTSTNIITENEKRKIFEELRIENEKVLQEYKIKMKYEFQNQLKFILSELQSSDDLVSSSSSPSSPMKSSFPSTPIKSHEADKVNQIFFEASKHQDKAPVINLYEGKSKKVKIKASIENSDIIKPTSIDINGNNLNPEKKKSNESNVQKIRPGLEPYTQTITPQYMIDSIKNKNNPKLTKSQYQELVKERNLLAQSLKPSKDENLDKFEKRMNSSTLEVLSKSTNLLKETSEITKSYKKQINKKKSNQVNNQKIDDSNNPSLPSLSQQINTSINYQTVIISNSQLKKTSSLPRLNSGSNNNNSNNDNNNNNNNNNKDNKDINNDNIQEDNEVNEQEENLKSKQVKYVRNSYSEDGIDGYLNKYDWENVLARNILSVYATSNAKTNQSETVAILDLLEDSPNGDNHEVSNGLPSSPSKSKELKESGMFNNLKRERRSVEKKAIRPGVTSRSATMVRGKTSSSSPSRSPSPSRPSSALSTTGNRNNSINVGNQRRKSTEPDLNRRNSNIKSNKNDKNEKTTKRNQSFCVEEVDPTSNVGVNSFEKLQKQNHKQRDEIKTTTRTSGVMSVVRAPAKCFPIWFYSSGDIYAEWILLPNGHKLQSYLDKLFEEKNYIQYIEVVSKILEDCWIDTVYNQSNNTKVNELTTITEVTSTSTATATATATSSKSQTKKRNKIEIDKVITSNQSNLTHHEMRSLCRQFILVCNAFATLCLENKNYSTSMILIRNAEDWVKREDIFNIPTERNELRGYIHITLAFYFYRKKMTSAAISHTNQALDYMTKLDKEDYIAMCLLMLSCCKYQVSNFKESHRILYQILEMVQEGRLSFTETNPKELCMIAVTYHNLAVIQMKLQVPDAAAKSSQNARKIARLCLSYSNRWINIFHWTHQLALEDVKYQLNHNYNLTNEQRNTMVQLTELLYEPNPT